jgi:hypothetical protein
MRSLSRGLFCAALAACGGDGGGGSGVDGDRAFADTTVDERVQICSWYADVYIDADLVRFGCFGVAIDAAAGDRELCQDLAQQCLDQQSEEDLDVALRDELECNLDYLAILPACGSQLTVDAFEDCMGGYVANLEDVAADASCDSTLEELRRAIDLRELPECADLVEACPDLLGL